MFTPVITFRFSSRGLDGAQKKRPIRVALIRSDVQLTDYCTHLAVRAQARVPGAISKPWRHAQTVFACVLSVEMFVEFTIRSPAISAG